MNIPFEAGIGQEQPFTVSEHFRSSTAVGNWESGEFLPKGRYVAKLAGALGIDVAALLGEAPQSIDDLVEEVRLLVAFRVLPKERQLIAIKLLEALKLTGN